MPDSPPPSPEPEPEAGPDAGPDAGSEEPPVEALVGVPVRRRVVAPPPSAVRRARAARREEPVRSWIPLGTVDAGVLADVDPAGAIHPSRQSWILDWWIGAEDRWHHSSTDAAVRQHSLDGSPVVVTSMKVPGGDIVVRSGGVQADAGQWSGPAVGVEIENLTGVPVALAVVVRPWLLDARGRVGEVSLEGATVSVDGVPAVLMSRPPARVVSGRSDLVAPELAEGRDGPAEGFSQTAGDDGDLEVAFVLPLAHTATVRLLTAMAPPGPERRGLLGRRRSTPGPSEPWTAPELSSVASGWSVHGGSDARVVTPFATWNDLAAWSTNMVRLAGPSEVTRALDPDAPMPSGQLSGGRVGAVAEALASSGTREANEAVSAALAGAQRFSGAVELADGSDATTALVWASGASLSASRLLDGEVHVGPLAKAVHHLAKLERHDLGDLGGVGLRRSAAALRRAATALVTVGQPEVADDALAVSARIESHLADTAGADSKTEPGTNHGDPPSGGAHEVGQASTFLAAVTERDLMAAGDPAGLDRLARRLSERGQVGVSDVLDAEGRPAGVLGFDVAELAETRTTLLEMMVTDGPMGPVLVPAWPRAWEGRELEAHGVPTAWGRVSFALRWHGSRPALLWEVEAWLGDAERARTSAAPVVVAPGVDPSWSASGWSGEALLAPPADAGATGGGADTPVVGEGESFS